MKVAKFILYVIAFILILKFAGGIFSTKEGFSYQNCMAQGYTKSFCVTQPLPGMCRCPNGLIGRRAPGFGGACVCSYYTPPMYPIPDIY